MLNLVNSGPYLGWPLICFPQKVISSSPRAVAYLSIKFGEDRSWIVTCRAQTDKQTHANKRPNATDEPLAKFFNYIFF